MGFGAGTRAIWSVALAATLAVAVATVAISKSKPKKRAAATSAVAALKDVQGRRVGSVRFTPASRGRVLVTVRLTRLAPGFHGIHVHESGVCDAAAKDAAGATVPFFSAGGHLKTEDSQVHGQHAADMPPALVTGDGRAYARFFTDRIRVRSLLGGDGTAVIVHGLADNLANVPARYHSHTPDAGSTTFGPDEATLATGDSGGRVACGIVRRARRAA
jgi:Cu-Zn family superoxide dismutase